MAPSISLFSGIRQASTFTPMMVPKGFCRLIDAHEMIISLCAEVMIVCSIQHHVATSIEVNISHETIFPITDVVLDDVT